MKELFILLVFSSCLTSCAQSNKTNNKMIQVQNREVTANNIVDKIQEQVVRYPESPMYLLRINQEYCTYEVLVNDFPVEKHYSRGKDATGIKINRAILKSGEQTVTIRMYPFGDLLQKAFGDDEPFYDTLKGGSSMRIEVIKVPDWKNYDIAGEEIIKVVTTEGFDTNKFPGAGLPYYEFTFTFTAKVPYENEGWSNGIDLRKLDSTILRKKIWDYFKEYQQILEKKDVDADAKTYFNLFSREAKTEYWDKDKTERVCNELFKFNKIEDKEFQPLKGYELAFYGGGKIVTFKHSSGLDIDSRLRGKSALYFLYNNQYRVYFPGLYIYIPKDKYTGKEEDLKLEMIK